MYDIHQHFIITIKKLNLTVCLCLCACMRACVGVQLHVFIHYYCILLIKIQHFPPYDEYLFGFFVHCAFVCVQCCACTCLYKLRIHYYCILLIKMQYFSVLRHTFCAYKYCVISCYGCEQQLISTSALATCLLGLQTASTTYL